MSGRLVAAAPLSLDLGAEPIWQHLDERLHLGLPPAQVFDEGNSNGVLDVLVALTKTSLQDGE